MRGSGGGIGRRPGNPEKVTWRTEPSTCRFESCPLPSSMTDRAEIILGALGLVAMCAMALAIRILGR